MCVSGCGCGFVGVWLHRQVFGSVYVLGEHNYQLFLPITNAVQ